MEGVASKQPPWEQTGHQREDRLFPAEEPVPGDVWAGLEAGVLGADRSALDASVTSLRVQGRQDALGSRSSGQEATGSTAPVWQGSGEEMPPQGPCGGTPGCGEARVQQGRPQCIAALEANTRLELRVPAGHCVWRSARAAPHTLAWRGLITNTPGAPTDTGALSQR